MQHLGTKKRLLARIGRAYFLCAVVLTILLPLATALAPPGGLARAFFSTLPGATEPLFEDVTTTTVDLAFVEQRPDLPQRSHRVLWQGVWFSPRPEVVDFYAGADDAVVLSIDDEVILERGPSTGMHTESRTVALAAGAHRLSIDYRQGSGSRSLSVQWAQTGNTPAPLRPDRVFLEDPGTRGYWLGVVARQLGALVSLIWLIGVAAIAAVTLGPWCLAGAVRWYRAVCVTRGEDIGHRLYMLGPPAFLLVGVVFLIGTHTIYTWNVDEFLLPYYDMLVPRLLAVAIVSWGLLITPGVFLTSRLVKVYAALLFGVSFLFWVQGNLWVGDYGVLDGSAIDFAPLAWRVPYELGIWVGVLVASVIFFRPVSRVAPFASLVFLSLQCLASIVAHDGERRVQWAEPPAEIYEFSSGQNVILVVLDEFQSDLFAELVEHDRRWFDEQFSGFVYFADHAGAFPTTSLSMPAMLTGQTYRNDGPVREFVRGAFGQASILSGLYRSGFGVDVASILSTAWVDDWFPDEEGAATVAATRMSIPKPYVGVEDYREFTARQLIELSVFRHVPHIAKEALDRHPEWLEEFLAAESQDSLSAERQHEARSSQAFFSQFVDRMSVGQRGSVFKLLHLGIPHLPVVVDAGCTFVGRIPFTRDAYLGKSRCAVDLVSTFLDRLRELDLYDESLIVISSDHGTDLLPRGFTGDPRSSLTPQQLRATAGTGHALMLVKLPRSNGPLVASVAPTTHTDLPATLFDLLGLPHGFPGTPMFDRDPLASRTRAYGMYDVRQRFPTGYLDRLDVINIEGRLLDGEGWIYDRSILPPDLDLSASEIDFGSDDASPHLGPGWSRGTSEQVDGKTVTFVWGRGGRAVTFLSLPPVAARLMLRVSAAEARNRVIGVELDGQLLGDVTVRGDQFQDVELEIPGNPNRPRVSSLVWHFGVVEGSESPGVKVDRLSYRRH